MIRVSQGTEMTPHLLADLITRHKNEVAKRYRKLKDAYENKYEIFDRAVYPDKAEWKPDNRVSANFAKYMVDTMTGFLFGIPVTVTAQDEKVDAFVQKVSAYNFLEDKNAELSKMADIYGIAYEMYYTDEKPELGIAAFSPMDSFIVYDDTVINTPVFFIRYYTDADDNEVGSYSDKSIVRHFINRGEYQWTDEPKPHSFDGVPAVEYVGNEERLGLFENVLPLINEYNKALSEKANDVDYFADAYLKILGAKLDEEDTRDMRDNRLITIDCDGDKVPVVEFLAKPSADGTQENLLERLERLIFTTGMVADINNIDFGTASGIAIKYRLWAMSAVAKTKQNKFTAGMNRRFKLLFSHPLSGVKEDAWTELKYTFALNYPANLKEETEIARNLQGIVSRETQLSTLSIVGDVQDEIERIEAETKADSLGFVTKEGTGTYE